MALILLRVHASGMGTIHSPIKPLEDEEERVRAAVWSGFEAFDRALMHEGGEKIMRDGFRASLFPSLLACFRCLGGFELSWRSVCSPAKTFGGSGWV